MTVVVASSLVPFFRRPHSRVCLGGAIRQRGIHCVVFPHGAPLVVFRLVTLGEDKRLVLWTWKDGQKKTQKRNQSSGLFLNQWIRLCLMKNGRTEAATLGPGFRCRGSWTGPGCVFLLLQAFCSHLISTVPVTAYPTVWETDTDGTCEPAVLMIVDHSFRNILSPLQW